jgi:hypothetical protein
VLVAYFRNGICFPGIMTEAPILEPLLEIESIENNMIRQIKSEIKTGLEKAVSRQIRNNKVLEINFQRLLNDYQTLQVTSEHEKQCLELLNRLIRKTTDYIDNGKDPPYEWFIKKLINYKEELRNSSPSEFFFPRKIHKNLYIRRGEKFEREIFEICPLAKLLEKALEKEMVVIIPSKERWKSQLLFREGRLDLKRNEFTKQINIYALVAEVGTKNPLTKLFQEFGVKRDEKTKRVILNTIDKDFIFKFKSIMELIKFFGLGLENLESFIRNEVPKEPIKENKPIDFKRIEIPDIDSLITEIPKVRGLEKPILEQYRLDDAFSDLNSRKLYLCLYNMITNGRTKDEQMFIFRRALRKLTEVYEWYKDLCPVQRSDVPTGN